MHKFTWRHIDLYKDNMHTFTYMHAWRQAHANMHNGRLTTNRQMYRTWSLSIAAGMEQINRGAPFEVYSKSVCKTLNFNQVAFCTITSLQLAIKLDLGAILVTFFPGSGHECIVWTATHALALICVCVSDTKVSKSMVNERSCEQGDLRDSR